MPCGCAPSSARDVSTIGTRAPRTKPAEFGLRQEDEILGEHIAGLEIGHDQDLGASGDRRMDPFDLRCIHVDGVVECQRPVEDAAGDLPAVGHLAQRGRVDGRRNLGRDRLDSGKNCDPRRAKADLGKQIDGVLNDVALNVEIGENVDRGVGDEQCISMRRHIHDEDMADAPRRAQAGGRCGHRPHQLVGMQAAFHQHFAFALAHEFDASCGCCIAVRHIDKIVLVDGETMLRGQRL